MPDIRIARGRFEPSLLVRFIVTAATLLLPFTPSLAADATIVELYEDCRLADTNVVLAPGVVSPAQSAEIKARAAAVGNEPGTALARIVRVLKQSGINDIAVTRQGFEDCEPDTSGKFVEAVGTYCGPQLIHAEVLVDRETIISRDKPGVTFETFLREAIASLREQDIYDRPVVSIRNAPDCVEEESDTGNAGGDGAE